MLRPHFGVLSTEKEKKDAHHFLRHRSSHSHQLVNSEKDPHLAQEQNNQHILHLLNPSQYRTTTSLTPAVKRYQRIKLFQISCQMKRKQQHWMNYRNKFMHTCYKKLPLEVRTLRTHLSTSKTIFPLPEQTTQRSPMYSTLTSWMPSQIARTHWCQCSRTFISSSLAGKVVST